MRRHVVALVAFLVAGVVTNAAESNITLAEAQRKAQNHLQERTDGCPQLVGTPPSFSFAFSSGTQTLVGDWYYLRVRCTNDAYLVMVERTGAKVRSITCREARGSVGNYCYVVPTEGDPIPP